jgi:hypothetical protein
MASKIHFVSHVEKSYASVNVGDWVCSPYSYFSSFFSQYTCIFHSQWSILWHEIDKDDVVILGGGGQLDNSNELNEQINKLFRNCNNVIIWGSGTHRYMPGNSFDMKTAELAITYDKAKLVGVRDYNHPSGLPYLPCVSCMHPAFNEVVSNKPPVIRKIGVIRSALEGSFAVSGFPSSIDNSQPLYKILIYALESEAILVSSYHGAYWSQLLGLNTILPESRLEIDKYRYFKHQPLFYGQPIFDESVLSSLAESIKAPNGFLEESVILSHQFFEKVKKLIESALIKPAQSEIQTVQIMSKRNAQLEFTLNETWEFIKDLPDQQESSARPGSTTAKPLK